MKFAMAFLPIALIPMSAMAQLTLDTFNGTSETPVGGTYSARSRSNNTRGAWRTRDAQCSLQSNFLARMFGANVNRVA